MPATSGGASAMRSVLRLGVAIFDGDCIGAQLETRGVEPGHSCRHAGEGGAGYAAGRTAGGGERGRRNTRHEKTNQGHRDGGAGVLGFWGVGAARHELAAFK
jgi:hypothetical protein